MVKQDLKKKVNDSIDAFQKEIIQIGTDIYHHPELGYKENYAGALAAAKLKELGLDVEESLGITGCRGKALGKESGPCIAVLGELDAVICREHPDSNPDTGAVHACGHHIQTASMLGAAMGLIRSNGMKELTGTVDFMGVPAEEFVELEYRSNLRSQGSIQYFGGKQEWIAKGIFDSVDLAMMFHALAHPSPIKGVIGAGGNGFLAKKIRFIGKEAHAGASPEDGINALNAAVLAYNNIHAQRETFLEKDKIRVHSIMTKGGDLVNIVPDDVRLEMFVRGKTLDGILKANEKVNRSLQAGAFTVGADVVIEELPGYLPLRPYGPLDEIFETNLLHFLNPEEVQMGAEYASSFDFGDLSHLMPTLHPFIGGVKGNLHSREFQVTDPYLAYIIPAKVMAFTIIDLLWDGASIAKKLISDFSPIMTKTDYLSYLKQNSKTIKNTGF